MAAIDTIEILNGLDHEQDQTTSILYSIDSATGEAVRSEAISVPVSAKQANVIINNTYDPDGSTVFWRVRVTKLTGVTTTATTKTETEVTAWAELAQNAIAETGSIDVDCHSATLHIDVALSSTTAHTGTEVRCQIASEAGVDGSWSDLPGARFTCLSGTAVSAALTAATEPAGETVIAIANPVASGFDWDGKSIFIENTVAADCEIVYQVAHGADA